MGITYVSIDLETTGLDPNKDQVLEFAAIIEDTEKLLDYDEIPKFNFIIDVDRISGSPYALNLNKRIVEILSNIPKDDEEKKEYKITNKIICSDNIGLSFFHWLTNNGFDVEEDGRVKITVAGKNFASFDLNFIKNNLPSILTYVNFSSRYLDPAPLYVDFQNDEILPNLDECLKRANLNESVKHEALSDAWDVIRVLRKKY